VSGMSIESAVLTVAGLGTRMLPFSKEVPKEMMPLIVRTANGVAVVPVLHYIFDSLYGAGFRRLYLVVGRGKRVLRTTSRLIGATWSFCRGLKGIP